MPNGSLGKYGNPGNEESATCRFYLPFQGSNPTLSATLRVSIQDCTGNM